MFLVVIICCTIDLYCVFYVLSLVISICSRIGCKLFAFTVVGCLDNADCPEHQSCVAQTCQDPCLTSNPCRGEEECQVHDHQPACVKGIGDYH